MSHEHETEKCERRAHCAAKIAKLVLKCAEVTALVCVAHEIHRVHRAIDARRR